jgi:hypothetical protein
MTIVNENKCYIDVRTINLKQNSIGAAYISTYKRIGNSIPASDIDISFESIKGKKVYILTVSNSSSYSLNENTAISITSKQLAYPDAIFSLVGATFDPDADTYSFEMRAVRPNTVVFGTDINNYFGAQINLISSTCN